MNTLRKFCINCKTTVKHKNEICPLCNKEIEPPKYIRDWDELKECTSSTHYLKIEDCCGWIHPKNPVPEKDYYKNNQYLSTHTFYGKTHEYSTKLLQSFGFNVILANWDEIGL